MADYDRSLNGCHRTGQSSTSNLSVAHFNMSIHPSVSLALTMSNGKKRSYAINMPHESILHVCAGLLDVTFRRSKVSLSRTSGHDPVQINISQ